MADYYSILSRALQAPESASGAWRRGVYERTRQMLTRQLRAQRPPLPKSEVAAHRSALDAAIRRIEAEHSRHGQRVADAEHEAVPGPEDYSSESLMALDGNPTGVSWASNPIAWIGLAVVAAALLAGGYEFWPSRKTPDVPAAKTDTVRTVQTSRASSQISKATLSDGDLPPGVDGGETDAELPYYYRRQPVFYRTTHPAGTLIIDKLQRFLYLISPNNVALRYGIAVGGQCSDLAGLRRVTGKAEWPQWDPPQDMIDRKLAKPGILAGGPGNPLGARVLILDDGNSRIHGTNAPATIGRAVNFGCIRLTNSDVTDLYGRVAIGTRVVVGD